MTLVGGGLRITREQATTAKVVAAGLVAARREVVDIGLTKTADGYAVKINLSRPVPRDWPLANHISGVPVVLETVGGGHASHAHDEGSRNTPDGSPGA